MGFQSEGSLKPNTFHGNPHISVITSSMNVSRCCLYKEGRLLLYKSANKNTCSVVTEKISFEDKPTISRYSNRQKELIFAAVYFPGGCSNPSVTIRDDRSSVFLSKSNHSSVESITMRNCWEKKDLVFNYNSFEDHIQEQLWFCPLLYLFYTPSTHILTPHLYR